MSPKWNHEVNLKTLNDYKFAFLIGLMLDIVSSCFQFIHIVIVFQFAPHWNESGNQDLSCYKKFQSLNLDH